MIYYKILFVGGGNMTRAILGGLVKNGYPANQLFVLDRHVEKRQFLIEHYQVNVLDEMPNHLNPFNLIVLSVKPQSAKEACHQIKLCLGNHKPLILSLMAGLTTQIIEKWVGQNLSIIRAMPNTPSIVQAGATAIFCRESVTHEQEQEVQKILSAIGVVCKLEEEKYIDVITALSGSGTAYFFYFMEAMQSAAIEMGLPEEIAKRFTVQTAYGAAKLAQESSEALPILRARVTSKKGTTEAAIQVFDQQKAADIIKEAMKAARNRAQALSQELER